MSETSNFGILYLFPVPLDTEELKSALPQRNIEILSGLHFFVAEEAKSCRAFLKKALDSVDFTKIYIEELNEHSKQEEVAALLKPLLEGNNLGLMSEAGCPGIADPGAVLVELAHKKGIQVKPLVGPSSILLSVMASGFNGQNFAFVGYLPKEKKDRLKRIKDLERVSMQLGQPQFFIETPYRNEQLFAELLLSLKPETKLMVACDILGNDELIKSKSVSEWIKHKEINLHKKPCMFGIE